MADNVFAQGLGELRGAIARFLGWDPANETYEQELARKTPQTFNERGELNALAGRRAQLPESYARTAAEAERLKASMAKSFEREPGYDYGSILPFRKSQSVMDGRKTEWGIGYSDLVKSVVDAFQAPKKAYTGELDVGDPVAGVYHANNLALNVMGTGFLAGTAPGGAVGMAVKSPGGMWHPEAVNKLATPLKESISILDDARDAVPHAWADKAVKNYLNKYAGTDRDPLKDVRIPFGNDTRRWEDLVDNMILKEPANYYKQPFEVEGKQVPEWLAKTPKDEMVFNTKTPDIHPDIVPGARDTAAYAPAAIRDYMTHVGDYLHQIVVDGKWGPSFYQANKKLIESNPELAAAHERINQYAGSEMEYVTGTIEAAKKLGIDLKEAHPLQGYDLVRAVRETAANDARVAKEMEKAASASMKDLPVHKEYPEGFKWVELKLPEKLTPDQQKMVKKVDGGGAPYETLYEALGPDGKAIVNYYTREKATGRTPEEAWLAGRLAEEGNTMGHCVGGYCEPVASGESRIFSLRDPKGQSHVTVEVGRDGQKMTPGDFVRYAPRDIVSKVVADTGPEPIYHRTPEQGVNYVKQGREWGDKVRAHPEFQAWQKSWPENIIQIKGKQNRAPNKEYQKYAQDFVKQGKWGEVGDIQNTGLLGKKQAFNRLEDQINQWTYPGWDKRSNEGVKVDGRFIYKPARDLLEWRNNLKAEAQKLLKEYGTYIDDRELAEIQLKLRAMKNEGVQ